MPLKVERAEVWAATIEDKPGALACKLAKLSAAGANLAFALARRSPERPGEGVVFVTPLKGAKQLAAAEAAGFDRVNSVQAVRIETNDKRGLAGELGCKVAEAGINLRGFSAAAIGRTAVIYLGLDSAADATKAMRILKRK